MCKFKYGETNHQKMRTHTHCIYTCYALVDLEACMSCTIIVAAFHNALCPLSSKLAI